MSFGGSSTNDFKTQDHTVEESKTKTFASSGTGDDGPPGEVS
jgi:hypothetical protein